MRGPRGTSEVERGERRARSHPFPPVLLNLHSSSAPNPAPALTTSPFAPHPELTLPLGDEPHDLLGARAARASTSKMGTPSSATSKRPPSLGARATSALALFTNCGRQTGGPWFVVSDDAVFDGGAHAWPWLGQPKDIARHSRRWSGARRRGARRAGSARSAHQRPVRREGPAKVEERRNEQHGAGGERPGHQHERVTRRDAVRWSGSTAPRMELGECSPEDQRQLRGGGRATAKRRPPRLRWR